MTSGRSFSSSHKPSREGDESFSSEAFEIAIEMSSGEPLRYSNRSLVEQLILSEYALICREPVDGLYVTPSEEDLSTWFGVLFIRRGIYMGAVLRFTLTLPPDFGTSPELPKVVFDLNVFHPYINKATRELELSRFFSDGWKPEKHHLYHVLLVVQRTFFIYDADASICQNPEAAIMLRENREAFLAEAQKVIRESRSTVYDPVTTSDLHAIRFFPWDASVHEPLRRRLTGSLTESQMSTSSLFNSIGCLPLNNASAFRGKSGYSWVSPSEGLFMVEQPKRTELELPVSLSANDKDVGECGQKMVTKSSRWFTLQGCCSNGEVCCASISCKHPVTAALNSENKDDIEWDNTERASL